MLTKTRGVKPSLIMKNLSRTARFAILAVIAIIAVLVTRGFAFPTPTPTPCPDVPNRKFVLQIGGPGPDDFVDLKKGQGLAAFNTALKTLSASGGLYKIRLKPDQGPVNECYHPGDHASIKTDKATTSEVARNAPAGESAANDPNVTYRVTSNIATDIKNVLDTFQ